MENSRNYYGYNTSRDSQGSQGDDGRFWSQAYLTGMAFVQGTDLDLFGTPVGPVADYGIGMPPDSTDSVFCTLDDPCYTFGQHVPDQSPQSWGSLHALHPVPHPATPNGYGRSPRSRSSHSSDNRYNPYPPPRSQGGFGPGGSYHTAWQTSHTAQVTNPSPFFPFDTQPGSESATLQFPDPAEGPSIADTARSGYPRSALPPNDTRLLPQGSPLVRHKTLEAVPSTATVPTVITLERDTYLILNVRHRINDKHRIRLPYSKFSRKFVTITTEDVPSESDKSRNEPPKCADIEVSAWCKFSESKKNVQYLLYSFPLKTGMSMTFCPGCDDHSHGLASHHRMVDIAEKLTPYRYRMARGGVAKKNDQTLWELHAPTPDRPERPMFYLKLDETTRICFSFRSAEQVE